MIPSMFDKPNGAGALLTVFDTFTPTVGYSLRYLSINYFGQPVIRVRKDVAGNPEQDFTPSQLTDGTLATFLGANDGFVVTWYDQFGSNDATQTTATDQPKIWDSSTGLVLENGKPAVQFDGTSDVLTSTTLFQCNYISYVCTDSKNALSQRFNPTEQQYNWGLPEIGGNRAIVIYNPSFTSYQSAVSYTNIQSLITIQSQDVELFKNGSSILDTNQNVILGASPNAEKLNIGAYGENGAYNYFTGNFQEVIVYNTDQSANREAIEDNINDYYDIY